MTVVCSYRLSSFSYKFSATEIFAVDIIQLFFLDEPRMRSVATPRNCNNITFGFEKQVVKVYQKLLNFENKYFDFVEVKILFY